MNCPNCHTANRDSARFCRRCGLWLHNSCPNCGVDLPESPVFCDQCGFQVSRIAAVGHHGPDPRTYTSPSSHTVSHSGEVPPTELDRPPQPPAPETSTAASQSQDEASTSSLLQKYVPRELMEKLEAARASGTMAGERRVVTMLFCDVQGSTAVAEHLDPEDWTEIINGAFEHMIKPVYQYEGTVARLMGDGILAFFGAPIAHEDDPQRAVLAGLEIVSELDPYREQVAVRFGIDLNVRVGINTGPVVVGAVGSDLRMEYTAMGDAINLAARMEQTAEPGTVRIAHDTYRLVAPLFDTEELGSIELKGKGAPVQAYRVIGRKAEVGRLRGIAGLEVPLVGRTTEMAALSEAYDKVQKGIGGIVTLIGEAGIGKSRLIRELKSSKEGASKVSWFETSSQSYENSQPYNLFRRLIRGVIHASPNDPPEILREKIRANLEGQPPAQQDQARRVYESLFGLHSAAGEPPLEGQTFKQLFLTSTRDLWKSQADKKPSILICDDLHWADSASVELLSELFELTEKVPLLIVCSLRPERQSSGWLLKNKADSDFLHRYTELMLKPLSEQESKRLLIGLAPGAEIPQRLRQRILEKAAGNPYYLEEVVRGLMESQALIPENGAVHWAADEAIADFDLPDSLQALLVARIDRLQENARRTLQLASVVGHSFYYRVLARLGEPSSVLDRQLDVLVRDSMIREVAREPELEYVFSNVLTQEAAYQTILLRHRRQFHRQVGEALEVLFPERREELAPVLAVHFAEAGDDERTLTYHTLAGDAALRVSALEEAVAHYTQALHLALGEGDPAVTSDQLAHLFTRLGRAFENLYQFEKVAEIYAEMNAEAGERKDRALKLAYLIAMGTVSVTHTPLADADAGRLLAMQALELAKELGDRRAEAKAHWNLVLLHRFFIPDMQAAKKHGEISLDIARELGWEEHLAYIQNDLAFVYFGLYDLPRALFVLEEAQGLWRELGNLPMLTDNLNVSGMFKNFAGEYNESSALLREGLKVAKSIRNVWNYPPLYASLSDALSEQGFFGEAVANLQTSLELSEHGESTGGDVLTPSKLVQNYTELGMVDRGLEICEQLLTLDYSNWSLRMPEGFQAAKARLHLMNDDIEEARRAIEKASPKLDEVTVFPVVDHYIGLLVAEVRLALAEYSAVLELTEAYIHRYESAGFRYSLANLYYFRGMALLATKQAEQGRECLVRARKIAEETNSRRILWKIYAALADLEEEAGNSSMVAALRRQADETIHFIAEHIGNEEYRVSFLARSDVQAVLEKMS